MTINPYRPKTVGWFLLILSIGMFIGILMGKVADAMGWKGILCS